MLIKIHKVAATKQITNVDADFSPTITIVLISAGMVGCGVGNGEVGGGIAHSSPGCIINMCRNDENYLLSRIIGI